MLADRKNDVFWLAQFQAKEQTAAVLKDGTYMPAGRDAYLPVSTATWGMYQAVFSGLTEAIK